MTSSLETLPPELFPYILAYLSPEDTSALSQTCHRMNIITRDDKIWRQYLLKRYMVVILQTTEPIKDWDQQCYSYFSLIER
jgi:hypothetical protein